MMNKFKRLFKTCSPRRFAGYLVLAALSLLCGSARAIDFDYYFDACGGLVNGVAKYKCVLTQNVVVQTPTATHTNQTLRCTGWYNSSDYRSDGRLCANGGTFFNYYAGYATFYAKWVEDRYPVYYVSNFGTPTTNEQSAVASTRLTLAENSFERLGYHFLGWAAKSDAVRPDWSGGQANVLLDSYRDLHDLAHKDADGNLLYPVTLYAVWEENPFQYTVRFEANGGEGSMDDLRLTAGQTVNLPKCTFKPPEGRIFDHWLKEGGGSYSDGAEVKDLTKKDAGDLVIMQAVWSTVSYSIAYDANTSDSVSGTMSNTEVKYGERVNLRLCAYKRRGYTFAGWARSPDGPVEFADNEAVIQKLTTKNRDVVTLYAVWTPVPYVVRFDSNGGDGSMEDLLCVYDRSYALPPNRFTRVGGAFAGWTTNAANTVDFADGATISNLTSVANATNVLRVVWSNIAYHISFNGNGGEGAIPTMDCEYGTVYQLPSNAFARTGYVFTGWTTNVAMTAEYAEGASVSNLTVKADETVELFAAWRPIAYTIAFDANGGDGEEMPPLNCVYDEVYELPSNSYVKVNRTFAGWSCETAGKVDYVDGAQIENLTSTDGASLTFSAVWTKSVNELNAALDNDTLDFIGEESIVGKLSVVEAEGAVNGTCAKIDHDNGECAVRVELDGAGILTFRWRVINEPDGWHNDRTWVVRAVDSTSNTNLFMHAVQVDTSHEEDARTTDWEEATVAVPASAKAVMLTFSAEKSESVELHALFDNVRWTSSENPEPTPEDAPVINGAATVEGGKFRVTFAADKRFKYELIKNATLAPSDWTSFDPQLFLESDEDGNVSFEPTVDPAEPKLFYRVKVLKKD